MEANPGSVYQFPQLQQQVQQENREQENRERQLLEVQASTSASPRGPTPELPHTDYLQLFCFFLLKIYIL